MLKQNTSIKSLMHKSIEFADSSLNKSSRCIGLYVMGEAQNTALQEIPKY
jgi:hypothetical protein